MLGAGKGERARPGLGADRFGYRAGQDVVSSRPRRGPKKLPASTRVRITADADREAQEAAARSDPKVAGMLEGKTIVKVIVVPGRMVNYVVKSSVPP
jgi:hypothetical protein